MKAQRWEQINRIFHAALKCRTNPESVLDKECHGDTELRQEVGRLLASHEQAGGFLELPAIEVAAQSLARNEMIKRQNALDVQVVITVIQGPRKGKRVVLTSSNTYVFGRARDCFEVMPEEDPTVGRHHFALEIDHARVRIRDLGSLNGTFVNGKKLNPASSPGKTPTGRKAPSTFLDLHPGDKIQAGDTIFTLSFETFLLCSGCGQKTPFYSSSLSDPTDYLILCNKCRERKLLKHTE